MPKYKYKARTSSGKVINDIVDAVSQREVSDRLRNLKYVVLEIKEFKANPIGEFFTKINPFKPGVKSMDLTLFSRQLATLVTAGVPLVQGLSILEEQFESPAFKNVIKAIKTDKTEIILTEKCLPKVSGGKVMKKGETKTFAGFKGFGLSLFVQMMGSAFALGANPGLNTDDGAGTFILAIDPGLIGSREEYLKRSTELVKSVKSAKPIPGKEVLLPGERGDRLLKEAEESGTLEIADSIWEELCKFVEN